MGAMVRARETSRRYQGGGLRPPGRLPAAVVLAVVLIGAIERWWVAAHPIGTLTSDGAVIGLMALRLLHHGQLTAYMWGQSYGGSLEAVLTAAVFAVAGAGTSQLLATTALSSGLCAFALWRAGRRIVGEPAAQLGALAFWVWPASFLWRSLKPGGTYMIGLAIHLGRLRPWLVWAAGLALVCALGTAGLRDEPGQVLVAFPAPDVTMPADDSALLALLAAHHVKDAYAPYWIAYRVMFETGTRTEVTSYDYDRYPPIAPIAAAVGASPDPAYLFITASRTLGSFETWCREHDVGYREWHSRGFTVVQPTTKVNPGVLPHAVLH